MEAANAACGVGGSYWKRGEEELLFPHLEKGKVSLLFHTLLHDLVKES